MSMENQDEIQFNKSEKPSYFHAIDEKYPEIKKSLPEIFEEAANREDQNYVIWHRPAERFTYRELYQRAQDVAKGLIAAGLKRGDCVMGVGCQGSDGLVMMIAATSIGLIFTCPYMYAPVAKTINSYLETVTPKLILAGDCVAGLLGEKTFLSLNKVLRDREKCGTEIPQIYYDSITADFEECMQGNESAQPFSLLIEIGQTISDETLNEEKSLTGYNDPCFYTQSSGTTGKPKTLVCGGSYFTNTVSLRTDRLGFTKDNTIKGVMNMVTEDVGTIDEFISACQVGYRLVIFPKPINYLDDDTIIQEMCECIQKHKITFIDVDQFYGRMIAKDENLRDRYDLSTVTGFTLTSSQVAEIHKRSILKHYPLTFDAFGQSECYWITMPLKGKMNNKVTSVGRPLANIQARIVDENGNIVNRGVKGELQLKGPHFFLRYKDQPGLTQSMYTLDGWWKTGDSIWMDDDGDLYFVSRMSKTESFKVTGDVIYAAPIENVLRSHSEIKECCVVGIAGYETEDELTYVIVPHMTNSLTNEDIMEFAFKRMANQKEWPMRIKFTDKLPRHGPRQKVSKLMLIEELQRELSEDSSLYYVGYDFTQFNI